VRRAAEDRAGAIIHQHEVRDIDRKRPVRVERVLDLEAGIPAFLLGGLQLGGGGSARLAFGDEGGERLVLLRQREGDRMVRRDCGEARAEDGIGPGRENVEPVTLSNRRGEGEPEPKPLALADPVLLHQPDLVGPFVERIEAVEQLVGEIGDLEEPLAQFSPLDRGAGAPSLAVDHLLVGEDGHVDRVPIDLALLAVDQAGFVEIEEEGLLVAVIIGLAGGELPAPVQGEAQPFQLPAHRRDIVAGPASGMDLLLHRGILGRHSERVPPHRVEHLEALHPPVAGEHVPHRVVADMAHVDAPRRIGEHLQDIGLGLRAAVVGVEGPPFLPDSLPVRVGLERVEARSHEGKNLLAGVTL